MDDQLLLTGGSLVSLALDLLPDPPLLRGTLHVEILHSHRRAVGPLETVDQVFQLPPLLLSKKSFLLGVIDVKLPLEGLIRESVIRVVQPVQMTWRVGAMLRLIGQAEWVEVGLLVAHVLVVADHGHDLDHVGDVLLRGCASSRTRPHLRHNRCDLSGKIIILLAQCRRRCIGSISPTVHIVEVSSKRRMNRVRILDPLLVHLVEVNRAGPVGKVLPRVRITRFE